jgi:hypothetical protein
MPRTFLIFALTLPVAILIGFMLSDPLVGSNMAVTGGLLGLLALPFVITYHHRALVWSAWTVMTVFFLRGQPQLWMLLAVVSLTMSVLSRPLAKVKPKLLWTPSLMWATIFLVAVILATAKISGGIGLHSFGSEVYGGRRYITLLMAVVGLVALVMHPLPPANVKKDMAAFTLGSATAAVSNVAYFLGPAFYFVFLFFPVDMALDQAAYDLTPGYSTMRRLTGFAPACGAILSFCMVKWGIRGMLQVKPWRHGLILFGLGCGMVSGFRSTLVMPVLTAIVQFFAEGLHRTRYTLVVIGAAVVAFVLVAGFSEHLPLAAQRSLSFLPIRVDASAKKDADASIEWRLEMWSVVVKDIPTYFWRGKGFAIDPKDLYFAEESIKRGFAANYDFAIRAGDYHNGPLSLIIPFGIWGVIGFLWFCGASLQILWNNMRHCGSDLRIINAFLFATFVTRAIFFFVLYGSFHTDFWIFASIVGVSLSLNGGMARAKVNPALEYKRTPQQAKAVQLVEA